MILLSKVLFYLKSIFTFYFPHLIIFTKNDMTRTPDSLQFSVQISAAALSVDGKTLILAETDQV